MPTAVTGFQIASGEFYEVKEEAEYEETKLFLHTEAQKAIQVTSQNFPAFLDFIEAHAELVRKHCENYLMLQNIVNADAAREELLKMQEGVSFDATEEQRKIKTEDEELAHRSRSSRSEPIEDNNKVPNVQFEGKS